MQGETATGPASSDVERISVLLDGEMDRAEAERLIGALCADAGLRRHWHELHRACDALRSHEVAVCDAPAFSARVAAALATEPTVLAPRGAAGSASRRLWVPGLAVAASVAAIGFVAVPLLRAPESTQPQSMVQASDASAQKALPTITAARAGARATFNPYLAAHRELSGNSVVPRASAYLRDDEDR